MVTLKYTVAACSLKVAMTNKFVNSHFHSSDFPRNHKIDLNIKIISVYLSDGATILYKFVVSKNEKIPEFAMVMSDQFPFSEPFQHIAAFDTSPCRGYIDKRYDAFVKCMPTGDLIRLLSVCPESYMALSVILWTWQQNVSFYSHFLYRIVTLSIAATFGNCSGMHQPQNIYN